MFLFCVLNFCFPFFYLLSALHRRALLADQNIVIFDGFSFFLALFVLVLSAPHRRALLKVRQEFSQSLERVLFLVWLECVPWIDEQEHVLSRLWRI